jgi:hypothetical protein
MASASRPKSYRDSPRWPHFPTYGRSICRSLLIHKNEVFSGKSICRMGTATSARMRALFVLGAICAVTIGLISPGFSPPAIAVARGVPVECPHHIAKQNVSAASPVGLPSQAPRRSSLPGCPHCCLAAYLGTAVLPMRSASFARAERRVPSRVRYADYSASALKPVSTQAANGARAPPVA